MFPVLLRIGNLQLYSYGVMLFISFILGITFVESRARRFGVQPKKISDLALWVLIAVVLGARFFYVGFHWEEFRQNPINTIKFWGNPPGLSGLMFYGGLLGGFLAGLLFVWRNRLPLVRLLDAVAPALVLGEGFTRIGCFLNGCCFGKPTGSIFGVVFPPNSAAGATFPNQAIHPTQLYSSFAGFVLFGLALLLERKRLKPGVLFSIILILYSLFRFGIDFVRFYENAANFWGNQVVSLVLALAGAVLLLVFTRKK